MATLATLRTDTYAILNEPQTSNIYSTDFIDLCLNTKQTELSARSKWSFLRTKALYDAPVQTALTANITTISTTLAVGDTTNFPATGAVMVDNDIITYTGVTATTLTGCDGIDLDHTSGATVYPLIVVPTNYFRMPELRVQRSVGGKFYPFTYVDELEFWQSWVTTRFTIVHDDDGTKYFLVVGVSVSDILSFMYLKTPTDLSDDADVSSIPDPWARKILPQMAASEALMLRGDNIEGLGSSLLQKAETDIIKMLKYYGEREQSLRGLVDKQYKSGIPNYRTTISLRN